MTFGDGDGFGIYLGDLAGWAERREQWTPEQVAEQLLLEQLVHTPDDLNTYRRCVYEDLAKAGRNGLESLQTRRDLLAAGITLARVRSALAALEQLTPADIARAAARLAARDAQARDDAGRANEAAASDAEALEWADRAADLDLGGEGPR